MMNTLVGLRVLNTRPKNQAKALSQSIRDVQGIVIECPTIEIKALNNNWLNKLPNLNTVDKAVFVSANAVHHVFTQLQRHHIKWPTEIGIVTLGHGSAQALHDWNIQVTDMPAVADSEHVLELKSLQELKNQTVLLFKGLGGRKLIEERLLQRGAKVIIINVYRRIIPKICPQFINSIWRDNLVDIILLTSEQSINNLFKMFNEEAYDWLCEKPCLVISERLAKSASLLGIKKIIISHPDGMMNTLFDYYQGFIHGQ